MEVDLRRLLGQAAARADRQRRASRAALKDDEQAILETVRTALGPAGLIEAGTGVLRRCSELEETLDHTVVPEYRIEYSIKHARVVRSNAESATVDLDATLEAITTEGGARTRTRAQGPVQLVREGGAWKVADMVVDGVSLRSSYFEEGVSGSVDGVTVRVLGGRVFPVHVWAYLELSNELGRAVKVESVTLGQRRSLLPGWRWARGRLAIGTFEPGTARVDTIAALEHMHAAAALRLLLKTDAGFIDARPQKVRRARRRVPVAVRYPWAWGTASVTAIVVPLGLLFGWWIAGIVLVQVAGVTLLSFEGHLRRGVSRATLLRLGWAVAGFATGAVLFFANGGFGGFRGESDRQRVTRYVEGVSQGRVLEATKVTEDAIGPCDYRVWDVQTTKGRWWAVSVKGRRTGLPVTVYRHGEFASAAKLISFRVAENRRLSEELTKLLGKRASSLPPAC